MQIISVIISHVYSPKYAICFVIFFSYSVAVLFYQPALLGSPFFAEKNINFSRSPPDFHFWRPLPCIVNLGFSCSTLLRGLESSPFCFLSPKANLRGGGQLFCCCFLPDSGLLLLCGNFQMNYFSHSRSFHLDAQKMESKNRLTTSRPRTSLLKPQAGGADVPETSWLD